MSPSSHNAKDITSTPTAGRQKSRLKYASILVGLIALLATIVINGVRDRAFPTNKPSYSTTVISNNSNDISVHLRPLLSSAAAVYLPGSDGFAQASQRWQEWKKPTFAAIVRVASDADIAATIQYATRRNTPFLAIAGGHGGTAALAGVRDGIGIWLHGLDRISIDSAANVAVIGGGVTSGELVRALSAARKQTTTGACACTGAVAPMLGGGHGWLQGRYGEAGDQLLAARLTVANGSTVAVSPDHHADLFWALRGAGANFGIVSELTLRIYDIPPEGDVWAWRRLVYTREAVARVYGELNRAVHAAPVELSHLTMIMRVPAVDAVDNVLVVFMLWQGAQFPSTYLDPLVALQPRAIEEGLAPSIDDVFEISGMHESSPSCQRGEAWQRWPVNWRTYNVSALQNVYDLVNSLPPSFNLSSAVTGVFSSAGKQAVPLASTAIADRDNRILLSPFLIYSPAQPELDDQAAKYGRKFRQAYIDGLNGDPVYSYVNYASGYESDEEIYGHEPWRLEKLRKLKKVWDPYERFSHYAPIHLQ